MARADWMSGVLVALERRVDAGDLVVGRRQAGFALTAFVDVAQAGHDVRFERRKLFVSQLTELHAHLRGKKLLAKRSVVVQLRVGRGGDLVEDEPEPADEERIENDQWARSSFNRMLTKL